jgi:hypothetical protein
MNKKYEPGDIHAPIEDTDVPLSLKVLVVVMIMALGGAVGLLVMSVEGLKQLLGL